MYDWLTDEQIAQLYKELSEVKEQRDKLAGKIENFINAHEGADGRLSINDADTLRDMEGRAMKLNKKIEEIQDKLLSQPSKEDRERYKRCLPIPGANPFDFSGYQKAGVAGKEYRAQFINAFRTNFKHAQDYLREASLPDGGYLCPTEFNDSIVTTLEQDNILRQIGRIITTASEHKIPIVATKPAASWIGEGQEISFSNETFGSVNISAHKLAVAIKVSNELLADSFYNLEQHLISEFATAFATAEEDAMLNGQGESANQPLGILPALTASPSTTIKTKGADISADDLLDLQYSLKRPYRRRTCWIVSDSTLAKIRKFKDSTQNYIWTPSLQETEPEKLFGQPVYSSPFMPTAESGNVVALYGDFTDYFVVGERGQREVQPLRELYAMSGQTAFLMTERIDSAITNLEAIKALKLK